MKKFRIYFACLVLTLAADSALSFLHVLSVFMLLFVGGIISVAVSVAYWLGLYAAYKKLKKSFGISTSVFAVLVLAVPLLISGGLFVTVIQLDNAGYWDGVFFGGLGEYLFSLSALIHCGAKAAGFPIIAGIMHKIGKKKANKTE